VSSLELYHPDDPAELGYPPTLPIEVAMKESSIEEICKSYGLDRDDWNRLRHNPAFVADVAAAVEALKKEGMSFKMKARLQSEELLKTSWKMIHASSEEVPPSVKADLLKFTIKAAGLVEENKPNNTPQNALQININLG
jgi:hypothetical protein